MGELMEGAVQQAPQPGRHCMGVDCALALRAVGRCLLCFTWNKLGLLVFFVLPCMHESERFVGAARGGV